MGQDVGKLPDTEVTVPCSGRVTADVIQNQIRNRGAAFATSPDADLLRAASKWVSDQYSWVLSDLQLSVYGRDVGNTWVFHAGSRANQVAFHATSKKIDEPAWERRGWKATIYNGVKMGLKLAGKILPLAAPVAAAFPALGAVGGFAFGAAGIAAGGLADKM